MKPDKIKFINSSAIFSTLCRFNNMRQINNVWNRYHETGETTNTNIKFKNGRCCQGN